MSESLIHSVSADQQNALKVVRASKPRTRKSSKVMYCHYNNCDYYCCYYWCHRYKQDNTQNNIFVRAQNIWSKLWGHFLPCKVIFSLTGHVCCCHLGMSPRIRFFELKSFHHRCLFLLEVVQDGKLTPAARSGLFRLQFGCFICFSTSFSTEIKGFKERQMVKNIF